MIDVDEVVLALVGSLVSVQDDAARYTGHETHAYRLISSDTIQIVIRKAPDAASDPNLASVPSRRRASGKTGCLPSRPCRRIFQNDPSDSIPTTAQDDFNSSESHEETLPDGHDTFLV